MCPSQYREPCFQKHAKKCWDRKKLVWGPDTPDEYKWWLVLISLYKLWSTRFNFRTRSQSYNWSYVLKTKFVLNYSLVRIITCSMSIIEVICQLCLNLRQNLYFSYFKQRLCVNAITYSFSFAKGSIIVILYQVFSWILYLPITSK